MAIAQKVKRVEISKALEELIKAWDCELQELREERKICSEDGLKEYLKGHIGAYKTVIRDLKRVISSSKQEEKE